MIYLDSSAAVKLVRREPESSALAGWLADQPELASSVLLRVELRRAVSRAAEDAGAQVEEVLGSIALLDLDGRAVRAAAAVPPATLRTLDAIHLGTALTTDDIEVFVTYDRRLATAARENGLDVLAPGSDPTAG